MQNSRPVQSSGEKLIISVFNVLENDKNVLSALDCFLLTWDQNREACTPFTWSLREYIWQLSHFIMHKNHPDSLIKVYIPYISSSIFLLLSLSTVLLLLSSNPFLPPKPLIGFCGTKKRPFQPASQGTQKPMPPDCSFWYLESLMACSTSRKSRDFATYWRNNRS